MKVYAVGVSTEAAADGERLCVLLWLHHKLGVALVVSNSSAAVTVASRLLTVHPHKQCRAEEHPPPLC
jgi:hypothetical protein